MTAAREMFLRCLERVREMAGKPGEDWLRASDQLALQALLGAHDIMCDAIQDAARGVGTVGQAHRHLQEIGVLP